MNQKQSRIGDSEKWGWNETEMKIAGAVTNRSYVMDEVAGTKFTPINSRLPLSDISANRGSQEGRQSLYIGSHDTKGEDGNPKRSRAKELKPASQAKRRRKEPGPKKGRAVDKKQNHSDTSLLTGFSRTKPNPAVQSSTNKDQASSHVCEKEPLSRNVSSASVHTQSIHGSLADSYQTGFTSEGVQINVSSSGSSTIVIPDTPPPPYSDDNIFSYGPIAESCFVPPNSAQGTQILSESDYGGTPIFEGSPPVETFTRPIDSNVPGSTTTVAGDYGVTPSQTLRTEASGPDVDSYDEFGDDFGDFTQLSEEEFEHHAPDMAVEGEPRTPRTPTSSVPSAIHKASDKPGLTFLAPKVYTPKTQMSPDKNLTGTLTEVEWTPAKGAKSVSRHSSPRSRQTSSQLRHTSSMSRPNPKIANPMPPPPRPCLSNKSDDLGLTKESIAPNVIRFDESCNASPFARPPFPSPLQDRSPIPGLTSRTCLRTCFRIGEALNAFASTSRSNIDAVIELYARVLASHREGYKQIFHLGDLFTPTKPPYLDGIFGLWRSDQLWDADSKPLLTVAGNQAVEEKRMCRVVGRMKRNEKMEVEMMILSVWGCSWEDVEIAKGVICA